jgi:ABC-type spermidine/putrescine transport system permease subunit II
MERKGPMAVVKKTLFTIMAWVVVLLVVFPLLWMTSTSFKPLTELYALPVEFLPADCGTGFVCGTTTHFERLLFETPFPIYFRNSALVATMTTALVIIVATLGAHSIVKFTYRGRTMVAQMILFTYLLPSVVLVIPLYLMMSWLGIVNTMFSLVIAYTTFALPFALWLLRSFMSGIPPDLEYAAMVDGASSLITSVHAGLATGGWRRGRAANVLDTGAHFYDAYETLDGKYVSIGSIEPQFYAELLHLLGLENEELPHQMDNTRWPELKDRVTAIFRTKSRSEWEAIFEGSDVCFGPVLEPWEAPNHPHAKARGAFEEVAGVVQPAPAPRFSRTKSKIQGPPAYPGQHTDEILAEIGLNGSKGEELKTAGAVR